MIRTLKSILVVVLLAALMSVGSATPASGIAGDVHTKTGQNCISKAFEYNTSIKVVVTNNRASGQCRSRVEATCLVVGTGHFAGRIGTGPAVVVANPGQVATAHGWCYNGEYVGFVDWHTLWVT